MCEPTAISLGLTALSTVAGIAGQAQQASAQQAMHGYQAAVARNNQIAAERLAQDAQTRGEIAEQRQRTKTAQVAGAQLARLAAQGTDLSGSESDILGDTAAAGEFDARAIRHNAARESWELRNKAAQFGSEAEVALSRQANAGLSGLGVGTSLLASAGAVADKWYKYEGLFTRPTFVDTSYGGLGGIGKINGNTFG